MKSKEPKPKAFIQFTEGPMDGLTLEWPNNAGDFPTAINFEFGKLLEPEKKHQSKRQIIVVNYEVTSSSSSGPILEDGTQQIEEATYEHMGTRVDALPSVAESWET